jgi:hypothetical protein
MNFKSIKKYLFFLLIAAHGAFSQGTISIDSNVDRASILIGDVFTYTVNISHDEDVQIISPSLAQNLGMFEIRDYKVSPPVEQDGKIVEQTQYMLSTFDTGEYEIPPLEIGYTIGLDTVINVIKTKPMVVNVASLNPDEAGDIRDIKPPLEPPKSFTRLIILVIIVVLAIGISVFLYYYFKRRKEGKALLPRRQKPPRPAHEIALEDLQKLLESDLLSTGRVKQYYIELSEIIRIYIENRFYIVSLEMTTDQLLGEMEKENLTPDYIETVKEFLINCDLVKFAKYIPTEKENAETTQSAFNFVEKSKLIFVQEETKEKAENELLSDNGDTQELTDVEIAEKEAE